MFGNILSCISHLWDVLCASISSTPPQIPSSSPSDSMPCTITSQIQSSTVSNAIASQDPSSSALYSTRWDVFLSFRGSDTRNKFTGHLYDKLDSNGIRTFKDDPELRSGEVISDALLDAIRKSKAYIVVFSENYASSSWCLDELAEILNCYKTRQRLVLPVFYNINPAIVRYQTGRFKLALQKHQIRHEMEKVNDWRLTLTQVASFSGYHVSENRSEADIINEIVNELLLQINPKTLDVTRYPVGLDSRVNAITTLLSTDTEGVIKFGIFGMGGVGKTTLAKALFNQLLGERSFKGSCFLANVRENSGTPKGLVSLQMQLINDVLSSTTKVEVQSVEQGISYIRERICSAKVLVLIDDIYDLEQFESLAGPFGSGSVVIITTRDEEMLDKVNVEPKYRYMLEVLDDAQSRELFTQYAFRNAEPPNNLLALYEDILGLAGGLPLALRIFGSYLSTKKEVGWVSYIETLQHYPNSTIEQKLLISLDALEWDDRMLKKIFIDIACFFIGWNKETAVEVLETYYSHADDKLDTLKKRCLLTVNKEKLEMHDLLRDVGRKVAYNNAPDEPGKHSRLWSAEDIRDVLKNHEGTEAIEGIIPRDSLYQDALEGESFTMETFKRMSKLRFLKLKNVNLTGSCKQTFQYLRWLHWQNCPLKCLPTEFDPQRLVILELPYSNMMTMWERNMVSHVYGNLKTVNISNSRYLTATPDFTKLPCLETLNLEGCGSLEEVHMSIGGLVRLQFLYLQGCVKLKSLPDSICNLRALKVLNISYCNSLEVLPIQLGNIKSLTELNAADLNVSELPDSIGHLTRLLKLNLDCNKKLETLPDTICDLGSLEILHIRDCKRLEALPMQLGNIGSLTELHVSGLNVSHLPDSMECLTNLIELNLSYNRKLVTLPGTICNLTSLETLKINGCEELEMLPDKLWKITRLRVLEARRNTKLKKLPDIGSSQIGLSLQELNLSESGIITLPSGFTQLSRLQYLRLNECRDLRSIPEFPPNLKEIRANYCESLETLPNLSNLKHLELLLLSCCNGLTEILDLEQLTALKDLDLTCSGLKYIRGLEELTSIAVLQLGGSDSHLASKYLTKRLFQIYSKFGHQITVKVFAPNVGDFHRPDWIIESPYWTSESSDTESSGSKSTTVYAHLLSTESHNFLGIILCFKSRPNEYSFKFDCSIRNTTTGFIWTDTHDVPYRAELMVIVPKSIFSVRDEDHRIEITAQYCVIIDGIHLLYKTEHEMIGNEQGNRSD